MFRVAQYLGPFPVYFLAIYSNVFSVGHAAAEQVHHALCIWKQGHHAIDVLWWIGPVVTTAFVIVSQHPDRGDTVVDTDEVRPRVLGKGQVV